jgi:hypothetical protein
MGTSTLSLYMNFGLVWMGPDDDSDELPGVREGSAAMPHHASGAVRYEKRGTGMVRREHLDNGRVKFTAVANFLARIVRDIVLEDDAGQRREFGVEAEVAGRMLAFVVPAAEFGRMGWLLSSFNLATKARC